MSSDRELIDKETKEHLFEYYEYKCARCGYDDFPQILQIHHVVPVSIGGNNAISNLIILCPNCHRLYHSGILDMVDIRLYQRSEKGFYLTTKWSDP